MELYNHKGDSAMEAVYVNWLAVVLAAAAAWILGSLWYAKPVFGAMWMKLAKVESNKKTMRPLPVALVIAFGAWLLAALVVAHIAALANAFYDVDALSTALNTAFWLWVGISLTTIVLHDTFEGRHWKVSFINSSYQFFGLLVVGLIIGLFGGF